MVDALPPPSSRAGACAAFFELDASANLSWRSGAREFLGLPDSAPLPELEQFLQHHVHRGDLARVRQALMPQGAGAPNASVQVRVVRHEPAPEFFAARLWLEQGPGGAVRGGVFVPERPTPEWLAAELQLHRALQLAGLAIWRVDLATQQIAYSGLPHYIANAVGLAQGVPWTWVHDAVHPDDLGRVMAANARALQCDESVEVMARYRIVDQGWQQVLSRRTVQRDENGQPVALLGISLDRTEQIAEADRIVQLTSHFRLAAEAVGAGFWSRELDADTVQWDEQMHRLHAWPSDQAPPGQGEWIQALVHPLDQERVRSWLQQTAVQGDATSECRFRSARALTGERWIHAWMRRQTSQGRTLAFGMHMDVTTQHLAELNRQRERERTDYTLKAAGVGVWEHHIDDEHDHWNEVMYQLRGLDPKDPRPIRAINAAVMGADEQQRVFDLYLHHVLTGAPAQTEFKITRPDGSERWIQTSGHLIFAPDGKRVIAGVNQDVTVRKEAERLRAEKRLLEQASREKSAFMARMSHELRTPMNAVLGFAQLLSGDAQEPPTARQAERLERIEQAARRLLSMIDDVLQLVNSADADADADAAGGALAPVEPVAPQAEPARSVGRQVQVLYVEDNPVNLLLVKELLALRPAITLHAAEDGHSALAQLAKVQPQIFLLDLQLPDITGLDLLRLLRGRGDLQGAQFIALSANAMPQDIREAREAGFDDYWTKPIDMPLFLQRMDELILELPPSS